MGGIAVIGNLARDVVDDGPPRVVLVLLGRHAHLAGQIDAGRQLSKDVKLKLIRCRVAHADRLGVFVTR